MKGYGLLSPAVEELDRWTVEEAIQASRNWIIAGGDVGDPSSPIFQWSAWHEELPKLQRRHEQGDSSALLDAVSRCALRGLPLPSWCRKAYLSSWRKAKSYKCRTLDEAFGYNLKGANLARARERYELSLVVAILVARNIKAGATVEDALQAVSQANGVSFSRAREWYYALRQHPSVAAYLPAESENPRKD